jgi:hypothetical protein
MIAAVSLIYTLIYRLGMDRIEITASNNFYIVACWFIVVEMRLPCHFLTMTVSIRSTIPRSSLTSQYDKG